MQHSSDCMGDHLTWGGRTPGKLSMQLLPHLRLTFTIDKPLPPPLYRNLYLIDFILVFLRWDRWVECIRPVFLSLIYQPPVLSPPWVVTTRQVPFPGLRVLRVDRTVKTTPRTESPAMYSTVKDRPAHQSIQEVHLVDQMAAVITHIVTMRTPFKCEEANNVMFVANFLKM